MTINDYDNPRSLPQDAGWYHIHLPWNTLAIDLNKLSIKERGIAETRGTDIAEVSHYFIDEPVDDSIAVANVAGPEIGPLQIDISISLGVADTFFFHSLLGFAS